LLGGDNMSLGEMAPVMIEKVGKYLRATNQINEKEKNLSDEEIGKIRFEQGDGFFKLYKNAERFFN
jgi:hypothetical protein